MYLQEDPLLKIQNRLVADDVKGVGIIEIIAIFRLLLQVYECLKKDSPEKIVASVRSPSLLQKTLLKVQVRRALGGKAYREYGKQTVRAILEAASRMESWEIEQLMAMSELVD